MKGVRILIQSRSDRDLDPERRLMWGDHWVKYELAREFSRKGSTVVDKDPDVILHLFGSPPKATLPDHTLNIVWLYSHPDLVTPENLKQFRKIYCASQDFIPKLAQMGYENVELMLPSTSKRPLSLPPRYDIVFLGNARASRRDGRSIVRDMGGTPYDFKVWGNLWEKILPRKYYGGRYWDYRTLEHLYASARITLTDHHPDMARQGFVSNKVFDVLASGGFVISDENHGISNIFGDAVPQYESPEHLKQLVEHFLEHPDERQRPMLRGRKIALANTYSDRVLQFSKWLL
ncbi:MAG: glycosyltransferase family 1 protein, partial [Deltaproteobacteria bacterium]|nr:glycosyltransferase family 1 protein [Deltaproteobacteria bacterium]